MTLIEYFNEIYINPDKILFIVTGEAESFIGSNVPPWDKNDILKDGDASIPSKMSLPYS